MQISKDGVFDWKKAGMLAIPAAFVIYLIQAPTTPPTQPSVSARAEQSPIELSSAKSELPPVPVRSAGAADNSTPAGNAALLSEYLQPPSDHSKSAAYQREWWMVKGAILQQGYPCAAVAYITEMADGTFKAVCKVKRNTNKYIGFQIDPNAQTVVPFNG